MYLKTKVKNNAFVVHGQSNSIYKPNDITIAPIITQFFRIQI